MSVTIEEIEAKTILSGWCDGGWFAGNYNMNLYRGCCHGCIYCDSRSECYGIDRFDTVRVKKNALAILEHELRGKRRRGICHVGAMSDSYNPFERELRVTRGALELIARYRFGAGLTTKSDLAVRDLDVLQEIAKHHAAEVSFTVTTADDDLCRRIEQRVCPTSARLAALRTLRRGGISGGVLLMPVLPFINDTEENILSVVHLAADAGAQWVFPFEGFGVTLRANQREWFYDCLDREFPGLRAKYVRTYGNSYECNVPANRRLWELFVRECERLGLLYKMDDIAALMRASIPPEPVQTSMF